MNVPALLASLDAVGARLTVGEAGGLKLSGKRPPAALLDEVMALKPELLAHLTALHTPAPLVPVPAPNTFPSPVTADPLPEHLAALVNAAKEAGTLSKRTAHLASGLVTDLAVYVLAWAECWPRDRAHILWRLEEAHAVTVKS